MADVAVDTAVYTNFFVFPIRSGPVWIDQSTGYVFFSDSANNGVRYRKTEDGGLTWGASVLISAGATPDWVVSMDIWFDKWTPGDSGTKIHVWWCELVTDIVHYRSLDTADDSLGTDETVFTGVSFNVGGRTVSLVSGTKAVGGNLYVQFWGDSDEHGFARSLSVDEGGNWAARTDGADGDGADEIICLPDADSADNQDIAMAYWDRSENKIYIKKYDASDNSWSKTEVGAANDTNAMKQIGAVVRHSDGNIIIAAWNSFALPTADLKVWDISLATPTVTAKTNVATDADGENDATCVGLFINQNTDDLYCAFFAGTFSGFMTAFYKKSDDGAASWGARAAYQEDAADDARYISAGHSTPGGGAGLFMPMFFNDDLNDLFVNVANSVALAGAVVAAAAAIADPAVFEVKLGELPQTLPRRVAEALRQDTEAEVE